MPYDPYMPVDDEPIPPIMTAAGGGRGLLQWVRSGGASRWKQDQEARRARARERARAQLEYLNNPMARLRSVFGADFDELINPGGNQRLYRSLYEQGVRGSGARQRRVLKGLRARGGGAMGAYGVGALLSDLESSSELSGLIGEAQTRSIGENAEFRRMLGREQLGREHDLFSQQRAGDIQGRLAEQQQQYALDRMAAERRGRRRRVGVGPVGISF